jgi:hypothetical protein
MVILGKTLKEVVVAKSVFRLFYDLVVTDLMCTE